jgi:hypothetical protein
MLCRGSAFTRTRHPDKTPANRKTSQRARWVHSKVDRDLQLQLIAGVARTSRKSADFAIAMNAIDRET